MQTCNARFGLVPVWACWLVASAKSVRVRAGAKTQAHPESTVGVLTMSGKTPRVLVTPTPDLGKVLNCMTEVDVEGESNISASVQIAQLALKHRQNKNQRQRIVIFVGSPVTEEKVRLSVIPVLTPARSIPCGPCPKCPRPSKCPRPVQQNPSTRQTNFW